jgi:hypothetical protein
MVDIEEKEKKHINTEFILYLIFIQLYSTKRYIRPGSKPSVRPYGTRVYNNKHAPPNYLYEEKSVDACLSDTLYKLAISWLVSHRLHSDYYHSRYCTYCWTKYWIDK